LTNNVDIFETENGKSIKITFIKHGSLMIDFDGINLAIDPVSDYCNYKKMLKADYIFITHEHSDHLDKRAINDLRKPSTKIFSNENSIKILGEGEIIRNGYEMDIDDINVCIIPAYNTTKTFHPKGRDNGYIFKYDNFSIYISGDTENIDEMSNIDVDVAFISVNQPYTMTIEQAINSIENMKAKIVYPYHYSDTDVSKIANYFKNNKSCEIRIRDMQ
jgi:L-ascorbate metabolism protein UlaG (beta-lactamase superfamily)